MLIPTHINKKLYSFLIFALTFLLIISLSLPWVYAKEEPKTQPQDWQINGIMAALDDSYPGVWGSAFYLVREYELKNLDEKQAKKIAKKAVNLLKDEKADSRVRSSATEALGNLEDAAKPYVKDILAFLKDEKADSRVRSGAAVALGNLGDAAKPYVKDIFTILKDEKVDSRVRSDAAVALGNLGDAAKPYVKDIVAFLKDEKADSRVRSDAAVALGNLGDAAKPYVKDIVAILKDENVDSSVRYYAVEALGNLGDAAKPYVKDIIAILKDENVGSWVRSGAAVALGNLRDAAKPYVKDIIAILKDEKTHLNVRFGAAYALGNLRDAAQPYVKDIIAILKDEKTHLNVRYHIALALGNLGDAAKTDIKDIFTILKDEKVDSSVRYNLAVALGNLGDAAKPYVKDIVAFLKDEKLDSTVRSSAASALGNLGDAAKPYVKDIVAFLKDEKLDSTVRSSAASVLGKIEKLSLNQVLTILNTLYYPSEPYLDSWRFQTYFLAGGTEEIKTLMKWLGHYDSSKIPTKLTHKEAKKTLEMFAQIWQPSQDFTRLRKDLAYRIVQVAKLVSWQPQDMVLLQTHYNNLKQAGYNEADSIQSIIINLKGWRYFFSFRNTIIIHFLFWLALIFAYPKSPQIQAIFFWNPWVRRIGGMGYVGFLLTWVPFLRGKLLEPFRPSLLADAQLDNFDEDLYFPESLVKLPVSPANKGIRNPHQPIGKAIPAIQGQIILQADSGLGKSMFLRHLAKNSRRNVVFLPARKCEHGVIKAIQDKLHGQAQDESFLKNLIYSGALDICIDGLNEVTADTRANICKFVESYFKGNIIMTTQPLEWIAPTTAKIYELQPLTEQQIEKFMFSRVSYLTSNAVSYSHQNLNHQKPTNPNLNNQESINQTFIRKYEAACQKFLKTTLNKQQPDEELAASLRIISNPMDLSLISQMISQGEQPDIFNLQEQQYNLMSKEYKREWGHDFPLKKFSQAVYQMRLNDEGALPGEEFAQELESMEDEKYKMVISRYISTEEEKKHDKEYYFRHDKIMDFFLVQNFLGESEEVQNRLVEHMDDPRFRGVYFLLANLLPLDAAKNLREKLINYAADTKDHTVSDKFVQLLRTR